MDTRRTVLLRLPPALLARVDEAVCEEDMSRTAWLLAALEWVLAERARRGSEELVAPALGRATAPGG